MNNTGAARVAAWFLAISWFFSSCSGTAPSNKLPEGAEPYVIPAFRDAVFHEEQALTEGALKVDFSALDQGYVGVQAESNNPLKLQIECGDMKYNYNIPNDGTTAILPINMGNGAYTFRLLENVGDNKYSCPWIGSRTVALSSEFEPFLRPSQLVSYNEESQCVAVAKSLAANCATDADVAAAVYDYLVDHISYDRAKAATVQPGYLPDPDSTLSQKKGICFDYASLAAAMLRSLGIPCKLVTGYVDDLYHAWNCFYLQEQGWVTVEIKAKPGLWQRVDITMAASGTKTKDLEDDSKYTTRYTY